MVPANYTSCFWRIQSESGLNDWTRIFETNQYWKAEMMEGMLKENNIPCVVLNKQDSSYLFGVIELYVRPEDVVSALKLIRDNES